MFSSAQVVQEQIATRNFWKTSTTSALRDKSHIDHKRQLKREMKIRENARFKF